MPAKPPKKAMITSKIVGVVRASNSYCSSLRGVIKKYKVEMGTEKNTGVAKFLIDFLSSTKSKRPIDKPMPSIGRISGEINRAPMITAVLLVFRPTDSIQMEQISIQRLMPLNSTSLVVPARGCLPRWFRFQC